MSLITFASPWISDDSQKKRQSTMTSKNKTIKKTAMLPMVQTVTNGDDYVGASLQDMGGLDSHTSFSKEENILLNTDHDVPPFATSADNRQQRINELVQKMHTQNVDNDGGNLADFKPLTHPIVHTKKPETIQGDSPTYLPGIYKDKQHESGHSGPVAQSYATFAPNKMKQIDSMSNYNSVYQPPSAANSSQRYSQQENGTEPRLLEKINYMIHLLEDQAKEKTNHSLEEFVMFSLVGVFIIYVLDSFSRSGRYTR